jgi:hypothetical protein
MVPSRRESNRAGVIAVVVVALIQLGISAFYWIPDVRAEVALAPTWDIVGLVLVIVACSLIPSLPRWADRGITAALTALVFATLVVACGQGFLQREFGRELILVLDISYVQALFTMLHNAESFALYTLLMIAVVAGLIFAIAGPHFGIEHLRRFVHGRPRRQLGLVAGALGYLAVGGVTTGVHRPVTAEVASQLSLMWNLKDPLQATAHRLEEEAAPNRSLALPTDPAARATLPPRIYVFVVESYGHAVFSNHPAYRRFPAFLDEQAAALARAGYAIRSKFLRAPVFGGGSWMSDATLLCGVPVSNQKRFVSLFDSSVRCLPKYLADAGYRTILAAPSTEQHEDRFKRTYGFDAFYFKYDFHYAGPRFGWSFMPDQFVIDFIHQHEVEPHRAEPLFVTMVLTTSHVPWSAVPPLLPWGTLGDGSLYDHVPVTRFNNRLLSGRDYEAGYVTSIQYSLATIASYLERLPPDDRSLVLVLGDHQPQQPIASRWKDDRWVPIHVLGRDAATVDRFARFGYAPGITPPVPTSPPEGNEHIMGELLTACGAAEP